MGNRPSRPFGSVHQCGSDSRPGYYISKKGVYYNGNIISDPFNFEKLLYGYAKNDNHVWYRGKIIPGADPVSFVVLNRGLSGNNTNYVLGHDRYGFYKFGIFLKNRM